MKIAFFEVDEHALPHSKETYPEAFISEQKLDDTNISEFKDYDVISVFIYSELTKNLLSQFTNLKMIATRGTGYDHIDVAYCEEKGISVANVPAYGIRTVAEHAFALTLTLTRKIYESIDRTKKGSFANDDLCGVDLFGKTFGIVGLGNIGREVLKIATGFGMNVIVYTRTQDNELQKTHPHTYGDLNKVLSESDVISLHIPYTPETRHIINRNNIYLCKKGSYLINTSRGGLIETDALIEALQKDIFAGVGLDVLEEEEDLREEAELLSPEFRRRVDYKTLVYDHMIVTHPKVIVTQHNAFNSQEARARIIYTTIENIQALEKGNLQNIVNKHNSH